METSLTTVTGPGMPSPPEARGIARLSAAAEPAPPPRPARPPKRLTRSQKAAVIVQLLIREGEPLPLEDLPDEAQAALTGLMGEMRLVDRDTLHAVVEEFVGELDGVGLTFPGGIEAALGLLDGHISPSTAARLRKEAGIAARGDPWDRIAALSGDRLLRILDEERTEVGAVMLSKLPVARAAELLGRLPGDQARELSYAISRTGGVRPETVRRIGLTLIAQIDAEPPIAFAADPVERVGAILNFSRAATRDDVLAGLDQTDAEFAAEVRRTIFTFAHIPARIVPRDVPRLLRGVEPPVVLTALAHAGTDPALAAAAEFLLENLSRRMADGLREELAEVGPVKPAEGEAAMTAIVLEIRRLIDAGEIVLQEDEAD